jgi:hypothetical protein
VIARGYALIITGKKIYLMLCEKALECGLYQNQVCAQLCSYSGKACSIGLNPTQHETNITMYVDNEAYEGERSYTYFLKRGRDLMPT